MSKRQILLSASLLLVCLALLIARIAAPPSDPAKPNKVKLSGAYHALDQWGKQRAYPNERVPEVGFGVAYEQTLAMRQERNGIDDSTPPWENLGPANIGGRTLCLALHPDNPDVMYAGSASGGLWKTTTAGMGADAWDYVDTGFPVLGVACIEFDPNDPDVMFIGTGEVYAYQGSTGGEVNRHTRGSYGMGALKTTDGGATWEMTIDWTYQQNRGVWMIRVHPDDSNLVFAATTEGIYRSTNGGNTWHLVNDVLMATDLRIHPANPDILFAAHGNFGSAGHGIYRSMDGGDSWQEMTVGLPSGFDGKAQLAISPIAPHVVYASIANLGAGYGLYSSVDLGSTWVHVNSTNYASYQGWYSHYVLCSPHDAQDLYCGGIEIWRSTNGGASLSERTQWQQIYFGTPPPEGPNGGPQYAHADHHFAVWHPTDPNTTFFCSDGGVFRTTDGGDTFRCLIGGYVTTQFYNGFSNSGTDPGIAMGGMQDNLSAIYQGTNAWNRVIGGDGSWTAINQFDHNRMFGSWQNLNMQRSTNGGGNWSGVSPPSQGGEQTAFIAPFVLSPSNPQVLYAGRERVYRSANEGSSWLTTNGGSALSPGNPVLALAISATDTDVCYATTSPISGRGRVFRTINAGGSWTEITGSLPDRYYPDIAVDPNDHDRVFVTLMGFGSSHLYRSDDAGDSWTDVGAGLPDVPTTAVAVDPNYPEAIYVGTDLGVFISLDSGGNWHSFDTGMQTTQVNDLKVFAPERRIRAATHGGGVFDRGMFDPTTVSVAGALPASEGAKLRIYPNPVVRGSRIQFELANGADVKLALFDVRGRRIRSFVDGTREAGTHSLPFSGEGLPAGVYFVRLEAGGAVKSARVVTLR